MQSMQGDLDPHPGPILPLLLQTVRGSHCGRILLPQLRRSPASFCLCGVQLPGKGCLERSNPSLQNTVENFICAVCSRCTFTEAMQDVRIQANPVDGLVPVPLHPTRLRERGFNQADALAETLSKRTRLPVLRCIQRRRYTSTQTQFDRVERMQNLRNAFALRKSNDVRGKHLVLLDDVLTTGSTLHECALVLRAAGAESVRAITVARG
jgi:ComF family protein